MLNTNKEIRMAAKREGVFMWQIAEKLGINDGNFSRRLRKELSVEEKEQIIKIIGEIKKEVQ